MATAPQNAGEQKKQQMNQEGEAEVQQSLENIRRLLHKY